MALLLLLLLSSRFVALVAQRVLREIFSWRLASVLASQDIPADSSDAPNEQSCASVETRDTELSTQIGRHKDTSISLRTALTHAPRKTHL